MAKSPNRENDMPVENTRFTIVETAYFIFVILVHSEIYSNIRPICAFRLKYDKKKDNNK